MPEAAITMLFLTGFAFTAGLLSFFAVWSFRLWVWRDYIDD